MSAIRVAAAVCLLVAAGATASSARRQDPYGEATAITQFQRSLDAYAFQHRQVQRRLGEGADQNAMAAALRAARPNAADGEFFTPLISVIFRIRIANAFKTAGCTLGALRTPGAEVPRLGQLGIDTAKVPDCIAKVLPHLPEELEYRSASVALILLDTHANVVVDVLHGAFRTP